ncbi:MAG: transcriptional regulator [Paracoccaceae bacterium]
MSLPKDSLAAVFRDRLHALVEAHPGGLARFARDVGIDRSALSQFLDPEQARLPRAETLRRLAERKGTSTDWLLGLANAQEGGQEVASSVAIETETGRAEDASRAEPPLARWHREAEGGKIRYVPAYLPDLFRLPGLEGEAVGEGRAEARARYAADMRDNAMVRDTDVEICMGRQVLESFAAGHGIWQGVAPGLRRDQLRHMGRESEKLYPAVRLHLFDAARTFSAPFTVFALKRAAVYLGRQYLVVTSAEQVRQLARHFDEIVREAVVPPHEVHLTLAELAERVPRAAAA